jgi:hypothetical protein
MTENINIEFKKVGTNSIYIKNNGLQLNIIPECIFETNGIYNLSNTKSKSIKINLNKKIKNHVKFIDTIKEIYNKCSEHLESEDDFNPDMITNPLNEFNDTIYNMNLFITDWNGKILSTFYDDSNNLIDMKDLEGKTFNIYPAINIEKISLNTNNNIAYINIILKECFVSNIKGKRLLDYEKYKSIKNNKEI